MADVYGITDMPDLPANVRAVEAVAIVRCVDLKTGDALLFTRVSSGIPSWELLGMLKGVTDDAARDFLSALGPAE